MLVYLMTEYLLLAVYVIQMQVLDQAMLEEMFGSNRHQSVRKSTASELGSLIVNWNESKN